MSSSCPFTRPLRARAVPLVLLMILGGCALPGPLPAPATTERRPDLPGLETAPARAAVSAAPATLPPRPSAAVRRPPPADRAQAEQALRQARQRSGLSDAQWALTETAERALAAGQIAEAAALLVPLNRALEQARQRYAVQPGDSLWRISARPEVYANGELWPLIWDANRAQLPDPERLRVGQRLSLRPHPTLDEIATALRESRLRAALRLEVGQPEALDP
ncbi:MAG TPA: LysM peptidoglycan-binding domain-containing protein [Nevskiaceae bacterium]|nr:LysM peptidoglycan-binding domain-containing protein [Nevskiaceae bacterium]